MDVVAQVRAALAPLIATGIVADVGPPASATYPDGLVPMGTRIAVDVVGDPEEHRAEIDRLKNEAGLEGVELILRPGPA